MIATRREGRRRKKKKKREKRKKFLDPKERNTVENLF